MFYRIFQEVVNLWLASIGKDELFDRLLEDELEKENGCVVCLQTENGIRTAAELKVIKSGKFFPEFFLVYVVILSEGTFRIFKKKSKKR